MVKGLASSNRRHILKSMNNDIPLAEQWEQPYFSFNTPSPHAMVAAIVSEAIEKAQARVKKPVAEWHVIDVGCGRGDYAEELGKRVKKVVAIEPCKELFEEALARNKNNPSIRVIHAAVEDVQLDEKFDLAISITTVEHMPEARRSFEKVMSLLIEGGAIFLTAPNKLWPIECHYALPFLSWLPLPIANMYLRLAGKGTSYKSCSYGRTYWGMRNLFKGLPCEIEFVLPDLSKGYLDVGRKDLRRVLIQRAGIALISRFPIFWSISKGFIMVIVKQSSPGRS